MPTCACWIPRAPPGAPRPTPVYNVVYAGDGADVVLTMCDGEVIYRAGEWPTSTSSAPRPNASPTPPHHQRALAISHASSSPAAPSFARPRFLPWPRASRPHLGASFCHLGLGQRHFDPRSAARGIFLSFGSETCDILGSRAAVLTMKNKVAAREVPGHSFVPPNPSSATRSQTSKNVRTRKDA